MENKQYDNIENLHSKNPRKHLKTKSLIDNSSKFTFEKGITFRRISKNINPFTNLKDLRLNLFIDDTKEDIWSLKNFEIFKEDGTPKLISSSSIGKLYLALNKLDEKFYAIRELPKSNNNSILMTMVKNQLNILPSLCHPNITKVFSVFESQRCYYMIQEYTVKESLFEYIKYHRNFGMKEKEAFCYFLKIMDAVKYVHDNHIIIRRLKIEDIYLDENDEIKLTDFSASIQFPVSQRNTYNVISKNHNKPKVVHRFHEDIYSLGIILFFLLHGHHPINNPREEIKSELSGACKDLLQELLSEERILINKVKDIFYHPWIAFYEKDNSINNKQEDVLNFSDFLNTYQYAPSLIKKKSTGIIDFSFEENGLVDDDKSIFDKVMGKLQEKQGKKKIVSDTLINKCNLKGEIHNDNSSYKELEISFNMNCREENQKVPQKMIKLLKPMSRTQKFNISNNIIDNKLNDKIKELKISSLKSGKTLNNLNIDNIFHSYDILDKAENNKNVILHSEDKKTNGISNFLSSLNFFKC